jgi:dihydropteroate synthase
MSESPRMTHSGLNRQIVRPAAFLAGRFEFPLRQRTYIMGILNVTPDSFSDGGQYMVIDQAIRHAEDLLHAGADILDIGGESTRPGFTPVSADEELQRVIPIIEKLTRSYDCPISIDTCKPAVAEAALASGACIVNDINGFQQNPEMASITYQFRAGAVLMHNARLYRRENEVSDIISDMRNFLLKSCNIALSAGLKPDQLMIDPGIGFGVTPEESIAMIARLDELNQMELPILLGPSRKRFIGHILGPSVDRLYGTIAAAVAGILFGADFIRVHDVREVAEAAKVADAIYMNRVSAKGVTC